MMGYVAGWLTWWELLLMRSITTALSLFVLAFSANYADAAGIRGDYVEARTADVFTGPCFSNAEIFITGKNAVMAWKVSEGSWKGVKLTNLCVAAAVVGTTTFSEDQPERAQSVLIVDAKATDREREALVDLAKTLGGNRLSHVAKVVTARMVLMVENHAASEADTDHGAHSMYSMPKAPRATFWAAGLAQIVTRPLDERDHACGNEVVAYPPLSAAVEAKPAYTLGHAFQGEGLSTQWADPNCRSSFVGHFAL
jgi:hypothetical protein